MRTRDIVLVTAAFALFIIGWIQDSPIVFNPYCSLLDDDGNVKGRYNRDEFRMPPKPVIVTVKQQIKDAIYQTRRFLITAGLDAVHSREVHFAELLNGGLLVHDNKFQSCARTVDWKGNKVNNILTFGSRVIGIGSGKISLNNNNNNEAGIYNSTLVAVVTDQYILSVFRADGVPVWKTVIAPDEHQLKEVHRASIVVVPQRIYKVDTGMVVVAMPARNIDDVTMTLYAAFNGADGSLRWRYLSDGGSLMDDVVAEAEGVANRTEAVGGRDDDIYNNVPQLAGNEPADEAVPGEAEAGQFQVSPNSQRKKIEKGARKVGSVPYISWKFEQPWSTYRNGLISALPHRYDHPWDASLHPHMLYRGNKANSKGGKIRIQPGDRLTFYYHDYESGGSVVLRMQDQNYDALSSRLKDLDSVMAGISEKNRLERENQSANQGPSNLNFANSLVFHGPEGIEVVHLYTGDRLTRLSPLRSEGASYEDVNDDGYIEVVYNRIGAGVSPNGNAVVQSDQDCLGVIDTGVPLGGEELLNATICDSVGFFGSFNVLRDYLEGEIANPSDNEQLGKPRTVLDRLELFGSSNVASGSTSAVTPIVVQAHTQRLRNLVQVERFSLFMIDTGLVTCVDPLKRRIRWRVQTDAEFGFTPAEVEGEAGEREVKKAENEEEQKDQRGNAFPHLAPYHPFAVIPSSHSFVKRFSQPSDYVVAVGTERASVVSVHDGRHHQSILLPCVPVAPTLVEDINGDGIKDLVFTCTSGLYVYAGDMNGGAPQSVAILILLVLSLVALLFFVREVAVITKVEEAIDGTDKTEAAHLRSLERQAFKRATD